MLLMIGKHPKKKRVPTVGLSDARKARDDARELVERSTAVSSSLSDLKNRSEAGQAGKPRSGCSQNSAGRGQILPVLQVNSRSIDQKSGEIWTGQADLQPISFKSDRLLGSKNLVHPQITQIYADMSGACLDGSCYPEGESDFPCNHLFMRCLICVNLRNLRILGLFAC